MMRGSPERIWPASLGARPIPGNSRASFTFLLEREPRESILRDFDPTVIGRYFPAYEREIRSRARG